MYVLIWYNEGGEWGRFGAPLAPSTGSKKSIRKTKSSLYSEISQNKKLFRHQELVDVMIRKTQQ